MIHFTTSVYISLAVLAYFTLFLVFSAFIKAGKAYNTPNKLIFELRAKYNVNIRTFCKNSSHYGFCWLKSIWINEILFNKPTELKYVFFHEYYHLQNKHKIKTLAMRFAFSLLPLLLSVMIWYLFLVIFITLAVFVQMQEERFEKKANTYANKMLSDEEEEGKG